MGRYVTLVICEYFVFLRCSPPRVEFGIPRKATSLTRCAQCRVPRDEYSPGELRKNPGKSGESVSAFRPYYYLSGVPHPRKEIAQRHRFPGELHARNNSRSDRPKLRREYPLADAAGSSGAAQRAIFSSHFVSAFEVAALRSQENVSRRARPFPNENYLSPEYSSPRRSHPRYLHIARIRIQDTSQSVDCSSEQFYQ